ncbi:MAG: c-type cytochrome [Ignavibacteriales bacterium]|nr:c-type cytochrome [Ignavibacteriales bacterium]
MVTLLSIKLQHLFLTQLIVADLPVVQARTVPPVDIFKMKDPTDELLQKGKELYTTNCASCHNETGAGGGPAAVGMNPAPRNFTSPDGWKNGQNTQCYLHYSRRGN